MKTNILVRVRKNFSSEFVGPEINRANMRKWVKALRRLGTLWLLHPDNAPKASHD